VFRASKYIDVADDPQITGEIQDQYAAEWNETSLQAQGAGISYLKKAMRSGEPVWDRITEQPVVLSAEIINDHGHQSWSNVTIWDMDGNIMICKEKIYIPRFRALSPLEALATQG